MRVEPLTTAGAARGADATVMAQRPLPALAQDPEAPVRPVVAVAGNHGFDGQSAEAAVPSRAAGKDAAEPDGLSLERTVQDMNRQIAQRATELNFQVDQASGKLVVKLVDTSTREVLRQMPSEQAMRMAEALNDDAARAGTLLKTDA